MNKIWLFGASICMVLALGSCKPKQSAYKAAYEQAKEKKSTAPVAVVEEEEVVEEVTPVSKPRTSNVSTRAERINAAQGEDASRLKRLLAFHQAERRHLDRRSRGQAREYSSPHVCLFAIRWHGYTCY